MEEQWWNEWTWDNAHQFMQYSFYSDDFDSICERNHDLLTILTGAFGLHFNASTTMVLDWGFLNMDVPLTASDEEYHTDQISPSGLYKDSMLFQSVYFAPDDSVPVAFDTRAMILVSPQAGDFISWEKPNDTLTLNGITASTHVQGAGIVEWMICDDQGHCHKICT